jgi:type VI protein secretion system component VasK
MKPSQFWFLTVGAGLTLLLAAVNIALFSANRSAQAEVAARGQYLQQTTELQGLYRQMAQALGELAVRNKDGQLRDLLANEGLTINAPPVPETEAASP